MLYFRKGLREKTEILLKIEYYRLQIQSRFDFNICRLYFKRCTQIYNLDAFLNGTLLIECL